MRTLLHYLFSISVPVVGGGAMQILPAGPASRATLRLWGKLLLVCVLFLVPLALLSLVDWLWLSIALVALALVFCVAVLFAVLDLATFYALPGLRIGDRALLVKGDGGRVRRYPYGKVAEIKQIELAEKGDTLYQVQIRFADGSQWQSRKRGAEALPMLVRFSDLVSDRSGRAVTPRFAA
jgi:hypothetical protein